MSYLFSSKRSAVAASALSSLFVCLFGLMCLPHLFAQRTPTWQRFGALQQARHSFIVHKITSEQALIVGGYVNASGVYSGTPTESCEILDAEKRTITEGPAMNDARAEFASVIMPDGTLVVVSGNGRAGVVPSVEMFSAQTNTWTRAGDLIIARRQHAACAINNDEILVVGGRLGNLNTLAAAEIFNIRTGQSRRIAEFPSPINSGVATLAANGRPIVFGGRSGGGTSSRTALIYEYNARTNQWNAAGTLGAAVQSVQIFRTADGKLFASGGTTREESAPLGGTKSVSVETSTGFRHIANMQADRVWHSMVQWSKDSLLTIGGLDNNNAPSKTADWINVSNNQSSAASALTEAHSHGAAVSLPVVGAKGNVVKPRVFMISGFTSGFRETANVDVLEIDTVAVMPPSISSFTPIRGTSGTTMIITGSGFGGVTSVSVGGILVQSFIINATTQITAVLGEVTSGRVRVTNSRGTAGKDGFTFALPGQVTTAARNLGRGVYHIVQDEQKNFYIPAQDLGIIYKITPNGIVSRFYTVPASYCTFGGGITRDKAGNIYVGYACQGKILKISPDGKQATTFYDNKVYSTFYGMDIDDDGNIWAVCDYTPSNNPGNHQDQLVKFTPDGKRTIVYEGTLVDYPSAVKLDGRGNVFVSSYGNHAVVKFSACGTASIFYKGPLVSCPQSLVIGESGNVYVGSNHPANGNPGHIITKITPTGEASIFAGTGVPGHRDGSLKDALFNGPLGLIFTDEGDMYMTDYYSGYLRKISGVGELPLNANVKPYPGPQFTDFSPKSGSSGTAITIRGANLSCVKEVSIGGVPVASFSIISDTEIRALAGAGATGAVSLIAPTGTVSHDRFTFLSPPTITEFTPTMVSLGATVVITGTNFTGATSVRFGGVESTLFTVNSDTHITAIVPAGTTNTSVTVQTPAGIATRSGLIPTQAPVISSFSISDGAASMGDTVVIRGRHFTGATSVRFGTISTSASTSNAVNAAMYTVVSDSLIIAIVGRGASGSVIVTTPAGMASRAGFIFVPAPVITRVQPNATTSGTWVNIVGLGFRGAHTVTFGSSTNPVPTPSFLVVSDSVIRAILPTFPMTINGSVFVTTSGGTASLADITISVRPTVPTPPSTSGTMTMTTSTMTMTMTSGTMTMTTGTIAGTTGTMPPATRATITLPPPSITAISPSRCLSPLRTVTITGTGFVNVVEVKCGIVGRNMIPVRTFSVLSPTQINVFLQGDFGPTLSSTDFGISVSTTTGTATRSGLHYVVRPPSITAFTPSLAAVGERVSIIGTGFSCAELVQFVGAGTSVNAQFTVISDSLLWANVPSGAPSGAVRVITTTGVAERSGFVLGQTLGNLLPSITSFTPSTAIGGTTVVLTGTNFSGTSTSGSFTTTAVSIGGVAVPFVVNSPTQITVRIPENFSAPSGDIRVTTPGGTVSAQGFTFIPAPVITDFTPPRAAQNGEVRITGRNFTGATSVLFGQVSTASFRVLSDSSIVATLGRGASGLVTVITAGGTAHKIGFIYLYPPTIAAFTPTSASSGSVVVITGANFSVNDGFSNFSAERVTFGGVPAFSFTVDSPNRITARLGAGTTGSVEVITQHGTATRAGFTLLLPPPSQMGTSGTTTPPTPTMPDAPRILGFAPASATVGSVVVITGTGFSGAGFAAQTVSFGGVRAQAFSIISSTEIRAIVGAGASGSVSVQTPHGSSNFQGFTFIAPPEPAILGFSPASGAAGDTVVIRGRNLRTTSAVSIAGDGGSVNAASFVVSGDTTVTAVLGKGQAFTFGTFRLTTLGGTAQATGFTYFAAPVITSFSPAIAGEGDAVVINGSGFTGLATVSFGGTAARSFTVNSDSRITAQVALGTTGAVSVIGRGGSASRTGFTFAPQPVIARFQPDSARAGDTVTISGSGFMALSYFRFGGVNAASYRIVSDSVIRAVPATTGASGEITLETPGGTARRAGFTFLAPLPTITQFTPQQASVGDIVNIFGTNFTGATAVRFGGRAAASFVINSPTQITARVANGTSGSVTVVTPGGTATLAGFVFIPAPPRIRSFAPASVGAGTTITIIGSDFSGATAVRFGATAVTSFNVIADSAITVRVPNLGASSVVVDIAVVSPSGTGTATGFRYLPAPVITSFMPQVAASGATVRIAGTGFTSVTAVRFGGANAQGFVIDSDTQISAIVGANAVSGAVSVVSSTGTASLNGFMFVPPVSLAILLTDFSPKTAPSGAVVTLQGANFREVVNVEFGGVPAQSFALLSPTTITAIVGTGASGAVRLVTRSVTLSTAGFVFVPAPVITSFAPQSASAGTVVVITGRNFTGATAVSFGGTAVSFTIDSDTRISARISIGSTGAVSVTGPGGTGTLAGFRFGGASSFFSSSFDNSITEDKQSSTLANSTTAVNDADGASNLSIRLFPNPTQQMVSVAVNIPESAEKLVVTLRDVLGVPHIVKSLVLQHGRKVETALNLETLSAGVYFLEARTNTGQMIMQKLVRE